MWDASWGLLMSQGLIVWAWTPCQVEERWKEAERFMGTKREDFMIILKDKKLEGQKTWLSYEESVIVFKAVFCW